MLAATGVKRTIVKEKTKNKKNKTKQNKNAYDFSSINRVTRKFLEVSRCSRAKQRQRNGRKKCAALVKLLFLLIRPIVVFSPFSLPSPLSITGFDILFEQTINTIKSFALALTKSVYYSVSN